jgi:hypothetical protein
VQLQLEVPVPSAHRLFPIDNKRFIEVALMTFDGNHDGEMTEFDFTPADIAGGQSGDLMKLCISSFCNRARLQSCRKGRKINVGFSP